MLATKNFHVNKFNSNLLKPLLKNALMSDGCFVIKKSPSDYTKQALSVTIGLLYRTIAIDSYEYAAQIIHFIFQLA